MLTSAEGSVEIFCSYSHRDEPMREKFEPIIAGLKNHLYIQVWHDRKITAGKDWASEIDSHLNSADIVTLLVSADFLASRYCYENEMGRALERQAEGKLVIVPIIVRPCDWEDEPFRRFQAIPAGGKAVTSWQNEDEAWTDISKSLKGAIREVLSRKLEMSKLGIEKYLADTLEARSITKKTMEDSLAKAAERERIQRDMQTKIFSLTQEIASRRRESADKSFNNMDAYIRG